MIKEACVGNLETALKAQKLGADQIELCDRLDLDGTSPSLEMVKNVCSGIDIPVKVIINPKPFNYTYSTKDLENILTYLEGLNRLPVKGIVFGPLTKEGIPDLDAVKLIAQNTTLPITYHKAIDNSYNIYESIALLKDQNIIQFILSSGGERTAAHGIRTLTKIKHLLADSAIQLIAAGKIDDNNLNAIHSKLKITYYHGKKIVGDLTQNG